MSGGVQGVAQTPADPARDALAAKHFPDVWARIAHAPGKSKVRQLYRRRAEHVEAVMQLRAEGKSCASCSSFERKGAARSACLMDSDFRGEVCVSADNLCHRWKARP